MDYSLVNLYIYLALFVSITLLLMLCIGVLRACVDSPEKAENVRHHFNDEKSGDDRDTNTDGRREISNSAIATINIEMSIPSQIQN